MCLVMRMLETGFVACDGGVWCGVCGEVNFAFGVLGRGGRKDVVNYYQGSGVGWGGGMVLVVCGGFEHDGA